jgi:hypothetical protein
MIRIFDKWYAGEQIKVNESDKACSKYNVGEEEIGGNILKESLRRLKGILECNFQADPSE